jgi:hypothetical protein
MRFLMLASVLFVIPFQAGNSLFNGVWIAQLEGRTFVRLEVASANGRLTGKIGTGNLHVNDQGEVTEASDVPSLLTPLSDIVVRDSTMAFTRLEGSDVEHFELRLLGDGTAEIEFLPSAELLRELKDQGIAVPKPIRLTKTR